MDKSLRVLIIDDSENDALLINEALKAGGFSIYSERVDTAESLKRELASKDWDIVICDYIMPALSVMEALSILSGEKTTARVIILTGVLNAEVDIAPDLIKAGASDFISKYELPKLVAAVEREVNRDVMEVEGIIKLEERKIVSLLPEKRLKHFVPMKNRFMKYFQVFALLVAACAGVIAVLGFSYSENIAYGTALETAGVMTMPLEKYGEHDLAFFGGDGNVLYSGKKSEAWMAKPGVVLGVKKTLGDKASRAIDLPSGGIVPEKIALLIRGAPGEAFYGVLAFNYTAGYKLNLRYAILPAVSSFLIVFVFFGTAALFWFIMSAAVLRPAGEIQASIRKMAAGDLASEISVEDNGEIGALAASFDEMRQNLKETFEKLKNEVRDRYFAEQALQALHLKLTGWVSELDKRTHEITILNQMGKILQSCKTVEEFHVVTMRYLEQLFPGDYGAVYLYNESGKFMEAVCMWGKETIEHGFVPDECWSLRSGHAYTTEGSETLNMLCGHIGGRALKKSNVQTACVPMTAQGETIGMFHLRSEQKADAHENMSEKRKFAKEQLVVAAAEHITIALSNLKLQDTLRQQSIHDSLTGLFNRRYMKDTLEREIYRAKRHNIPFGLIMADIDFFKKYNDVYGHDTGDMVLEKIGRLIKMTVRPEDVPCRYGGEEFLIVLPGEDSEGTNKCALRLQEETRRLKISNREKALKGITMSIGISAFPLDGETVELIVKAADNALFKAKENGRDCIVAAEGLLLDKPDIFANPEDNIS